MKSRYWIAVLCLSIISVSSLSAGLNRLESASDLSASRTSLDFTGLLAGATASKIFLPWGVVIESSTGQPPLIDFDIVGGQAATILSNPNDGNSGGEGLIFNLSRPVRQFGVTLRNGGPDTSADFSAYDNVGNLIGQIHVDMVNTTFGPFVGFETTGANESISKVVLDYGDSPNAEQILDLSLTFLTTPFFTTFLAQIGDGAFSQNFLQTSVIVTNLTNTTAQGEVRFIADDGGPLELTMVDAESGEALTTAGAVGVSLFPVAPFASRVFTTLGTDISPPVQGYAEIRSNVPFSATAVFRAVIDGQPFEAGVGGSLPLHRISAAVSRTSEGFDSGIAVANTNDDAVMATLQLLNAGGAVVAENSDFLNLDAGAHKAAFLPQLFPDITADFQGSILITTSLPLVVTVLRTIQGGIVSASLPVGGTEQ